MAHAGEKSAFGLIRLFGRPSRFLIIFDAVRQFGDIQNGKQHVRGGLRHRQARDRRALNLQLLI